MTAKDATTDVPGLSFLQHVLEALVEDKDQKNAGFMRGKAENGRTVVFPGESTIIGRIVPVLIEDCSTWTLIGKQV